MRDDGDVANDACIPSSLGFTAINRSSPFLSSPCQPPNVVQQNESEASHPSRSRNPTVASYLGLGSPAEPPFLSNHARARPTRKRRGTRSDKIKKAYKNDTKAGSDTSLSKDSHVDTNPNPINTKEEKYGRGLLTTPTPTVQSSVAAPLRERREISPREDPENESTLKPPYTQVTVAASEEVDDDEFGQLYFDFEPQDPAANVSPSQCQSTMATNAPKVQSEEEDFGDDFMDEDLLDLATEPVTLSSQDAANGDESRKPIVRSPFPTGVRDRSPIIGLTSNKLLRTCFRVGEAINQSCQAAKTGKNILIELYARILSSERDHLQQRFTFHDLFHAKPPYIQATYAAAIWKGVELYEYDSSRLLQAGSMCRCMGTMKRNGKDWVMTVLNIWEATWEDVQWVEGIINS